MKSKKRAIKLSAITPTHNPQWIAETYQSLQLQTFTNWEWIVACNGPHAAVYARHVTRLCKGDRRVKVHMSPIAGGIGAIKSHTFRLGTGDGLIELDHDDLLTSDAMAVIAGAIEENPECGFFFSEAANFSDDPNAPDDVQGRNHTYMELGAREAWEKEGWLFKTATVQGSRPGSYLYPCTFTPSPIAMSTILWAPNHVRVWRRDTYNHIGGHDGRFDIADDHELLVRTYLHTKMFHIPEVLYLYRCTGKNTWEPRAQEIAAISADTGAKQLEPMILREAKLRGLPVFDLGAGRDPRPGWQAVDQDAQRKPQIVTDLSKYPWPFNDNSVYAFRAFDLLEHLPDKLATMREIWRCLVPGGWLLSATPSTDGRGAFQDPSHLSYWNENSFWYWTRPEQMAYIEHLERVHDHPTQFMAAEIYTHTPTPWHKEHNIPYVVANLTALKPGYTGPRVVR